MSQPPAAPGWSPRRMAWVTSYTPSPPCWEPHSPLDWRQVARDKGMVWVGGAKGREGTEVGGIQAVGFGRSGCVRLGPGHLSVAL